MKKNHILTAMAIALCASSCSTTQTPSTTLNLEGEWKVITLNNETIPATMSAPMLTFITTDNTFSGVTGVNIINGSYTLDKEGNLTFSDGPTTKMMGDSISMVIEDAYIKAIAAVKSVNDNAGTLELKDATGKVVMTLSK